jgi:glycerol-3-phosphate cytidylyltransferase
MSKATKTVLTYGTFDLFHIGHLNLLRNLKALGSQLIVAVSTDEFNSIKGKKTVVPYHQRAEIVANIKFVDKVIPEFTWEQKRQDIEQNNVDIFAMGDDWVGKFDDLSDICEVIYLPRTKDISSTEIKDLVKGRLIDELDQIAKATDRLNSLVHGLMKK